MTYLSTLQSADKLPFSIAQVIPGTVIGPSEFSLTASQALAHMDRQTKALLFDDAKPRYAFGFVHVQDCARIHIKALDEENMKSEELPKWFIAAGTVAEGWDGEHLWGHAADMLEREFPRQVETGIFKVGRSKVPINMPFRADSRVTEKMLLDGEKIKGLAESITEVASWYLELSSRE
jgi:nucleoside-diphosphate-sugar epimerase